MAHPWAGRLGRRYKPDPRDWSRERLERRLPRRIPQPLPDHVLWADTVVLDQGDAGTCVGNGWAGWGIAQPISDSYTEADARRIYYEATCIGGSCDDPDAPGGGQQGSTVRDGAKAMAARGRLTGYAFAGTIDDIRAWLATHGPVVMGTNWTRDMFTPDTSGFIRPTGDVEGGHCYLCIGYGANGSFRFRNSWGSGWGLGGDVLMQAADVAALLAAQGEACLATELPLAAEPTADGCLPASLRRWVRQ